MLFNPSIDVDPPPMIWTPYLAIFFAIHVYNCDRNKKFSEPRALTFPNNPRRVLEPGLKQRLKLDEHYILYP